ncbi:helix-turn-helix transcriptional regulator [Streptomyces sp. B21-102]|uniref:helix-turn-helix transcriptional regulator n=1 Tax=Streptomyces sp. B21-102 TaxID=3039416 RepID=UPI002FF328EE
MTPQKPFATWLAEEMSLRGYDLNRYGERARFARDAGLHDSIVSRLLRGNAEPDIRSCLPIARVLGCKTTRVLAAAGLIPEDEDDAMPAPRPLTQRDHLVGLVGNDIAAQEAVIVLLRALGKWAS